MGIFDFFKKGKKEETYSEFDANNHFLPQIDIASFYILNGYELGWLMLEPISDLGRQKDEASVARKLSPGQKALHFIWYLDAQVTNGGFVQFYYNGYSKYVPAILAGLKLIGDELTYEMVLSAHAEYTKKQHLFNGKEDLFESGLYEELPVLDNLTDAYYSKPYNTLDVIAAYIKANPNEFCRDTEGNLIDAEKTGTITTFYKNKQIECQFGLTKGIMDGVFTRYYPNGNINLQLNYTNGQPTGVQQHFYENGKISKREVIDTKLETIVIKEFGENGNKLKENHYDLNGQRKGVSLEWHSNGQLKDECFYLDQYKRDGKWLKFFENGQLYIDSEFVNEKRLIYNVWDEDGTQTLKNGEGIFKWSYSKMYYIEEYSNSVPHGLTKYFQDGKLSSETMYENGMKHGTQISYYPSGKVKAKAIFEFDKKIREEEFADK